MPDEPENHTVRLLQELRGDIRDLKQDLTQRIDGNTILLNLLAGLLQDHEQRLVNLETKSS
jgi:hypothetical protein